MICYRCDEDKPIDYFGFEGRPPVGVRRSRVCGTCLGEESWWPKPTEQEYVRIRARSLGLDPDEVERRLDAHNGLCDICGQPETAVVSGKGKLKRLTLDHDHATGAFRGFLCSACNTMLGFAKDDVDRLVSGAAYLLRAAGKF